MVAGIGEVRVQVFNDEPAKVCANYDQKSSHLASKDTAKLEAQSIVTSEPPNQEVGAAGKVSSVFTRSEVSEVLTPMPKLEAEMEAKNHSAHFYSNFRGQGESSPNICIADCDFSQ